MTDVERVSRLQSLTYPLAHPGPYMAQNQSRPHEIIIDPSEKHMLVPDLGADLIRVFNISRDVNSLDTIHEQQIIQLSPGSTPRHGAFARLGDKTYFYVLEQNTNKLVSFGVNYHSGIMSFSRLGHTNLLLRMDQSEMDGSIQASEVAVSVSDCSTRAPQPLASPSDTDQRRLRSSRTTNLSLYRFAMIPLSALRRL